MRSSHSMQRLPSKNAMRFAKGLVKRSFFDSNREPHFKSVDQQSSYKALIPKVTKVLRSRPLTQGKTPMGIMPLHKEFSQIERSRKQTFPITKEYY
jgi:hypothetical protein